MKRPAYLASALAGLCVLTACGEAREDRMYFDGKFFRIDAKAPDKDQRAIFDVSVRPVSASLQGALEAGRFGGTEYCIENYGTSRILWAVGPDSDPTGLPLENDTLTLSGACAS